MQAKKEEKSVCEGEKHRKPIWLGIVCKLWELIQCLLNNFIIKFLIKSVI